MYLSYFQRPELQIFDPDICGTFPKFLPHMWGNFDPNNRDFRIFNGNEMQKMDGKQKLLSINSLSARINADIATGKYADGRFNIYLVSTTFYNAMIKSYGKLRPLMDEENALRNVYEDTVFIIGERTLVFVRLSDDQFRYMEFRRERLVHFSDFSINGEEDGLGQFKDMNTMTVAKIDGLEDILTPDLMLYQLSFILFFKKYGNIDLELLPAKEKVKKSSLLGEKINNFMGIDVQVLDSRWFTTICRDEGFLVSGHFRLQPCKDEQGEWTRKLIYINPYAKHGYHRLAPIVKLKKTTHKDYEDIINTARQCRGIRTMEREPLRGLSASV